MLGRIRAADVADAGAIASVQVASWRTTYPGIVAQEYIDRLSVEERRVGWEGRMRRDGVAALETLVAEDALGNVVGFASGGAIRTPYGDFDAELYAIYILKEAQGKGLGRALMRQWAGRVVARGFGSAVVRVLRDNPACQFYERLHGRMLKESALEIGGASYAEVWYGWDDLTALTA